jgi:hypothetical protein
MCERGFRGTARRKLVTVLNKKKMLFRRKPLRGEILEGENGPLRAIGLRGFA